MGVDVLLYGFSGNEIASKTHGEASKVFELLLLVRRWGQVVIAHCFTELLS